MRLTVLVADDEPAILRSLARALERRGYGVETSENGGGVLDLLSQKPVDAVLLDLHLGDTDGLTVLTNMRAKGYEQPVIMFSGEGTVEAAVKAVQLGASDFIQKPFVPERVLVTLENALRYTRLAQAHAELQAEVGPHEELLGSSPPMLRLKAMIDKAAPSEGRVLVTGENGTGKELVARAIHARSARREAPFVKFNCAAVPLTLIESELFGHEKGAFTGAVAPRRGRFESADHGTMFLDEVAEMPPEMQAKMLRVLQEGELERLGGQKAIKVDVRVIAATNRNLEQMIAEGRFREDLYYRLNVIRLEVPPLRARKEDVPLLTRRFVDLSTRRNRRAAATVTDAALAALVAYDFPGNVRELQNLVDRLVILTDSSTVDVADVQAVLLSASSAAAPAGGAFYRPQTTFHDMVEAAQRDILKSALREHKHNMTETARALGLERSHLYKKCRALGIALPSERD
jgi:DNA-binding NtrC family response regulator